MGVLDGTADYKVQLVKLSLEDKVGFEQASLVLDRYGLARHIAKQSCLWQTMAG